MDYQGEDMIPPQLIAAEPPVALPALNAVPRDLDILNSTHLSQLSTHFAGISNHEWTDLPGWPRLQPNREPYLPTHCPNTLFGAPRVLGTLSKILRHSLDSALAGNSLLLCRPSSLLVRHC